MTKYHVNAKGVPAICSARNGRCPYGGDTGSENHFESKEEAQKFADKMNESQFGVIPEVKDNIDDTMKKIQSFVNDKMMGFGDETYSVESTDGVHFLVAKVGFNEEVAHTFEKPEDAYLTMNQLNEKNQANKINKIIKKIHEMTEPNESIKELSHYQLGDKFLVDAKFQDENHKPSGSYIFENFDDERSAIEFKDKVKKALQ